MRKLLYFLIVYNALLINVFAVQTEYSFGVLAQKSAVATANTWNPLLLYVEKKTGIKLILKTARTGDESKKATDNGEYDFVYSNQIFGSAKQIYIPILKPNSVDISGQIVTLESSGIKSLYDLHKQPVGFPSKSAFVAYAVTTKHLNKQNIEFIEVFGGNQEGIMAQLKSGNIKAASVNSAIIKTYAQKENIAYKVLWESQKFVDIPIAANKMVPKDVTQKVQDAIANMATDPAGVRVLEDIAYITKQKPPLGYSKASLKSYQSYINFYKNAKE